MSISYTIQGRAIWIGWHKDKGAVIYDREFNILYEKNPKYVWLYVVNLSEYVCFVREIARRHFVKSPDEVLRKAVLLYEKIAPDIASEYIKNEERKDDDYLLEGAEILYREAQDAVEAREAWELSAVEQSPF